MNLLGIYDLILSCGAIYIGIEMINWGNDYPKEWLSKVPFENWITPGKIVIIVFGLGNIIASIFCLRKKNSRSWYMSAIMGGIFFISMVAQVVVLREAYLATLEFFTLSVIQLLFCGYAFLGCRIIK
jgi:hypothetical protein